MQSDKPDLVKFWEKWGGTWDKLQQSIEAGRDEKPWFLGIPQLKILEQLQNTDVKDWDKIENPESNSIGAEPVSSASVMAALPIIIGVIKLVSDYLPDGKVKDLAQKGADLYDKIANTDDPFDVSNLADWLDANFTTKVPKNDGSNGQPPY